MSIKITPNLYCYSMPSFYVNPSRQKNNIETNNNKPLTNSISFQSIYMPKSDYILGELKNDIRIIDVNSVTNALNPGSSVWQPCSQNQRTDFNNNSLHINEEFDNFRQGKRGDCYLLSSIYSLNQTQNGPKLLKKNIEYNKDGSVTITLPGAIIAKKGYEEEGNGNRCSITGKYTITKEALDKAKRLSGKSYAYGDIEVVIFELAMESYRAEVMRTNKALNQKPELYIPGQMCGRKSDDPLSGGQMYDAIYILTGKKSEIYVAPKTKKVKPYIQGEYGFVGQQKNTKYLKKSALIKSRKDEKEVTNVYNKESDLQKMLDKYAGKEKEYSITAGVVNGQKAPDGTTKIGGGHAIVVTKITDVFVEVVNPWDTTKKECIPRADFEKMAINLSVAKI